MANQYTYLDYAASAPLRAEALSALEQYRREPYACANPNSLHTMGRRAALALDGARARMARLLGGGFRPADIVFCGGGSESDNLAVLGIAEGMRAKDARRRRVILSAIEHDAVLDLARPLKDRGFVVDVLNPSALGQIAPDALAELLGPDVALVSVMAANSETGALQPTSTLGKLCKETGVPLHVDAIQAFGRVPLDLTNVSAVSVAGHKFGAPVSAAMLAIKTRTPFKPQAFGGGQERGIRPGTQDVANALALVAAAEVTVGHLTEWRGDVQAKAEWLMTQMRASSPAVHETLEGLSWQERLPGIVHVMVDGLDSETMVLELDALGFEVSAGSACSSGSLDISHVLKAMGVMRERAFGALRVSFDERVSKQDLERFVEAFRHVIAEHI